MKALKSIYTPGFILTIVLGVLKLYNAIKISWLWCVIPSLIVPTALLFLLVLLLIAGMLILLFTEPDIRE